MDNTKALSYLRSKFPFQPEIGLLDYTATPLFEKELKVEIRIPYSDIPYFTNTENIHGELILGSIDRFKVLVFRNHFKPENANHHGVSFPIEVMSHFGVASVLLIIEALSIYQSPGPEILIANDHFRLFHSLPAAAVSGIPPKVASNIYPPEFVDTAKTQAQKLGLRIPDGMICDGMGIGLVSNAEYEYLRTCGISAIGSFFAADAEAAYQHGIPLLAMALLHEKDQAQKQGVTALNKELRNLILGIISSL
ncbi:MAG TPA: hypothetical protein VJ911_02725 [Cryomorphaceae bacterium]|nr:hypothetical protein [Cryomorphaceae bacterium]